MGLRSDNDRGLNDLNDRLALCDEHTATERIPPRQVRLLSSPRRVSTQALSYFHRDTVTLQRLCQSTHQAQGQQSS